MNKYIKKCLIVYTSLALILVGMAGAAYAVTASDADQYITRSQFATDMAYLQNALDEAEAGLMGNINRYRTTEILFTTWDTPDLQSIGTGYGQGYHNGGNVFPHVITNTSSWHYSSGWFAANTAADIIRGSNNPLYLFRLWNGNYYITYNMWYRGSTDTSASVNYYIGMVKCAVPVENFPGWYIVLSSYQNVYAGQYWFAHLVKLDPNVPYPSSYTELKNANLRIRFKKGLWRKIYANKTYPTSSTPITFNPNTSYYTDYSLGPFASSYYNGISSAGTETLYFASWLEEETGDYMMTVRNMTPLFPDITMRGYTWYFNNSGFVAEGLIPSDNVEYMMGPIMYAQSREMGEGGTNETNNYPSPRYIGVPNKYSNDMFDIEIVDGVNGIKYWHCYKRPSKTKANGYMNSAMGWHYSIPIVY